jgi:hypothetical protein
MKKSFRILSFLVVMSFMFGFSFKTGIKEKVKSSLINGKLKKVLLSTYENRRTIYIDYSLPSYKKRLWVLDGKKVLLNTYVSHGKNSGLVYARKFSNSPESNMSCVGRFITLNSYTGKCGLSLRIMGIDESNSNTRSRSIVFHGSDYVNKNYIAKHGYAGRSLGCFATSWEDNEKIIELVKEKTSVMVVVVK